MPLFTKKSVFLMIPRTASTWCRQAIKTVGIRYRETNPKHDTEVRPQNPPLGPIPSFHFTFTRNPATWLRSRWSLGAWDDEFSRFWNVDYEKFREKINDSMIEMYFEKYTRKCQYVGKFESVADDLVTALRMAGEEFDEAVLRATPRINESPPHGDIIGSALWAMKPEQLCQLPPDQIGRLPIELLLKLPPNTLETLPPKILTEVVKRTTTEALQAGGAAAVASRR